jgi:hypothetical protein
MPDPAGSETRSSAVRVEFDDELSRQLEDWRRRQPEIPSKAASVRELVARALSYDSTHAVA